MMFLSVKRFRRNVRPKKQSLETNSVTLNIEAARFSETSEQKYCHTRCKNPPYGATAPRGPGPTHYRGFTITPSYTTTLWMSDQSDAETSTW
jgi:hypothetical protein